MDRRGFIKYCVLTGSLLLTERSFAFNSERSLYLYNIHTGEYVKEVYWENGIYNTEALKKINYLLRDHRTGDVKEIDINLIELLNEINSQLQNKKPIHIISGYRSPFSNEFLRKVSSGVAKNSMHILGKAADISIPGIPLHIVREVAINIGKGGVGYYPTSNFVHIDIGRFRVW
ncbi:MAG: YcbK family protein [Hydrogenothermaceae bacterium]